MWKFIKRALFGLLALVVLAVGIGVFVGWWLSAPITDQDLAEHKQSAQFKGNRFFNRETPAPFEVSREALGEALADHPRTNPTGQIPVVPLDVEALKRPAAPGLRIAWLGHASVLVEIDGKRILTDPVLSERASPFGFAGPKRFHEPPIKPDEIVGIDAVVVSHNHYDHLDKATVTALARHGTQFFVPLGSKTLLLNWDIPDSQVQELDWWREAQLGAVKIVATPARHYSSRGLFDYKKTLWASWSLIGPQSRVFFSGDTGYSSDFAKVGAKFGPFDATIIKVGAYGPGQAWLDVHMLPDDSVRVHKDVGGKTMLPVHWGTFNLAYHSWDEPIIRSVELARRTGIKLLTPKLGEMFKPGDEREFPAWWEAVDQ